MASLSKIGFTVNAQDQFFDTIKVTRRSKEKEDTILATVKAKEIKGRCLYDTELAFASDETDGKGEVEKLVGVFAGVKGQSVDIDQVMESEAPNKSDKDKL